MARWRLTNPANSDTYDWAINPSDEEEFGQERTIQHTAKTSGTGLVRQQGDPAPLVLKANGTILTEAQLTELNEWFQVCADHTVYLTDHAGDQYEGIISVFKPTRKRTIRNPRDQANAPLWYWTYRFEFDIVRVISGPWVGVTP